MRLLTLCFAFVYFLSAEEPFRVTVTGHGRPVILIPGLSSSGETWDTTVARYKSRFECHVLTVAGFAGVPRVASPVLERVRDGLAAYIRERKLDKPVIVGHSLGGFLALSLAAKYPELPGKLVIVDAYPYFAALSDPEITPEKAKETITGMRQYYSQMSQEMYEGFVKSGMSTRPMVEKESDFKRIVVWGLASDRTAVADAMTEMFATDLRDEIAKIQSPTLVLGSWIGFSQYTDRKRTEANLRRQYTKLVDLRIELTDTAHHFIMWDDPEWMFLLMDRFLGLFKAGLDQ